MPEYFLLTTHERRVRGWLAGIVGVFWRLGALSFLSLLRVERVGINPQRLLLIGPPLSVQFHVGIRTLLAASSYTHMRKLNLGAGVGSGRF